MTTATCTTDDTSPYDGTRPVASLAHTEGTVTFVEGTRFGDLRTGRRHARRLHGLFVLDTEMRSRSELHLNRHRLELSPCSPGEPFTTTFIGPARPAGAPTPTLTLRRTRHVGRETCARPLP